MKKKSLLLNLRYLILSLGLGLFIVANSNAQFTPDPNQKYYLVHKPGKYVMGPSSSDNSPVLFDANKDDGNQQMKFIQSPVAGQYYIRNQNGRYLYRIDGSGWVMGFSTDTTSSTTIGKYRFIITITTDGYALLSTAFNTAQYVGSNNTTTTVGTAIYGDKGNGDASKWKIWIPDSVTFKPKMTLSEHKLAYVEKNFKAFPLHVTGVNIQDTLVVQATSGFSVDKSQILPSEFVPGGFVKVGISAPSAAIGDSGKVKISRIKLGILVAFDSVKVTAVETYTRYNIKHVTSGLVIGSQSTNPLVPALTTKASLPSQRFMLRPVHPKITDSIYYVEQDADYQYFSKDSTSGWDTKLGVLEQGEWKVAFSTSGGYYTLQNQAITDLNYNYVAPDASAVDSRLYTNKGLGTNAHFLLIPLASNATLSDLKVDGATVNGFNTAVLTYSIELPYGTAIAPPVTATVTDANAGMVVQAASALPGATTVVVTAEDGGTQKTYTVNFTLAKPSNDATLKALTISTGTLTPAFSAGTLTYSVILPYGTTEVPAVTATQNDANAQTPVITAATALPGSSTITVMAQDGTTSLTYTVDFALADATTDATLKDLTVSTGTLTPAFNAGMLTYSVTLPFGTTEVPTVTATQNVPNAQTPVVITAATTLPGNTTVTVTAQSGSSQIYTVNFMLTNPSTDATLKALTVSTGTLTPAFSAGTLTYNVTLPYGTTEVPIVTATQNDANATPLVTAATALPGSTTITVTAQDGTTTKAYTVNFTVTPASTDATLSALSVSTGTLSPVFSASRLTYKVQLPAGTTTVPTVTATKSNTNATLVVTAAATLSDTTKVKVTAQDGTTTKTYNISFTVGTGVNTLSSLSVKAYPNPTANEVNVDVAIYNNDSYVTLISVNGKVMLTKKIVSTTTEISLDNLPFGTYFIKVVTPEGAAIKTIVKQ